MIYCTYNLLNMFWTLICPSSGAGNYTCVFSTYGVQCPGCWWSAVRCRTAGYASGMRKAAWAASLIADHQQPRHYTMCGNNTSIVSSSWWWAYKCLKHVEQIISAINHSAAFSWFSSLCIYNDAWTNIHQTDIIQFYYVWRLQIPSNL